MILVSPKTILMGLLLPHLCLGYGCPWKYGVKFAPEKYAGEISAITVATGKSKNASSGDPVEFKICSNDYFVSRDIITEEYCCSGKLSTNGQSGVIEVRDQASLGDCFNADMPVNAWGRDKLPTLILSKKGSDDWFADWFQIHLTGGLPLTCSVNDWISDSEKEFTCERSDITAISFVGNGKIDVSGEPLLGKISSCVATCRFSFDNTTITEEEGSLDKYWMPKKKKAFFSCYHIIWRCGYVPDVYFEERKVADKVDMVYVDFGITEIINKYISIKPGRFECHAEDYVSVDDAGTRWKSFKCNCLPEDKEKFSICNW